MAIIVVVAGTDRNLSNPQAYRQGDIIDVLPAGHNLGTKVVPPDYWIITIDGIDRTDPAIDTWLAAVTAVDGEGTVQMTQRRQLYLDLTALPPPVRNDILDDGYATVTVNRLQGFRDAVVAR